MRHATLLIALLFTVVASGQKPPELSKKAADQIKAIAAKITETPGEVVEKNTGEFINTKKVASDVDFVAAKSDYADKPIAAKIRWKSNQQQSKIYPTKAAAEKAKDWLKPGQIIGTDAFTKGVPHVATYYYVEDKWVLDEISWGLGATTAKGTLNKWTSVLGEPAKKPKPK